MQNGSAAALYRNIRVFDENGCELQPTYRKRAKGFVKHGRAQWCGTEQDSIVLIPVPPVPQDVRAADQMNDTEDTLMSDINNIENKTAEDITLKELLSRLEDLNDLIANCDDTDRLTVIGKLYTDTLDVIKDIKKQNQELELAQLKCSKE